MGFRTLAIIGPGLLGGSVALASRERLPGVKVRVWGRREEAVAEVLERGIAAEAGTDLAAAVRGADLVVLCVPVDAMPELARRMAPHVGRRALVTDVGSVKGVVAERVAPCFAGVARFVGSHPMAGSEQSGMAAARADLFDGEVCIVAPGADAAAEDVEAVSDWWRRLGCRVLEMSPERHDAAVGWVSHLPHLMASLLVELVGREDPGAFELAGNGFRDTTRVASGDAEMWAGILEANAVAVGRGIDAAIEKLGEIGRLLARSDRRGLVEFLAAAKDLRDGLRAGR